jgi:hypothetical protein
MGPSGDPLRDMQSKESLFNPADASMKVARGDFQPNMTVRDVFAKMGIDVDGPATQLTKLFQDQMQKRTMAGKMGMAPPAGGPQGQPPAPMPAPAPGGMAGLMQTMKG